MPGREQNKHPTQKAQETEDCNPLQIHEEQLAHFGFASLQAAALDVLPTCLTKIMIAPARFPRRRFF